MDDERSAGSELSTRKGAYLNAPATPVGTASGTEIEREVGRAGTLIGSEVGRAGMLIGSEVGSWGTGFATATAAKIKVTASLGNILI